MTQPSAREPPYRRHEPNSTGFGRFAPLGIVKQRQSDSPDSPAPPLLSARPLWAEMSDALGRKLGLALVRGEVPALRLRLASGQADLSADDVLELNTLLIELCPDIIPPDATE